MLLVSQILTIMPIYYKVYQSNRKGSKFQGKWYGRAAIIGTVDDDELAARIEEKCTVHKADVKAVITALVGEITQSLQESYRVHLVGLGTFKMGIATKPADERDKFGATNIKRCHVLFFPETHVDGATKKHTRAMTSGARFKPFSSLAASAGRTEDESESGGSGTSDNTGAGGTNA